MWHASMATYARDSRHALTPELVAAPFATQCRRPSLLAGNDFLSKWTFGTFCRKVTRSVGCSAEELAVRDRRPHVLAARPPMPPTAPTAPIAC